MLPPPRVSEFLDGRQHCNSNDCLMPCILKQLRGLPAVSDPAMQVTKPVVGRQPGAPITRSRISAHRRFKPNENVSCCEEGLLITKSDLTVVLIILPEITGGKSVFGSTELCHALNNVSFMSIIDATLGWCPL